MCMATSSTCLKVSTPQRAVHYMFYAGVESVFNVLEKSKLSSVVAGRKVLARAKQQGQVSWPAVISMWWIQTNPGPPCDTLVYSRWRELKSCNYVFLQGFCSDSQIFIKEHCSRCALLMFALNHHQHPAPSSPFLCLALLFHWAVWFSSQTCAGWCG